MIAGQDRIEQQASERVDGISSWLHEDAVVRTGMCAACSRLLKNEAARDSQQELWQLFPHLLPTRRTLLHYAEYAE
jgi:hypothetical protein